RGSPRASVDRPPVYRRTPLDDGAVATYQWATALRLPAREEGPMPAPDRALGSVPVHRRTFLKTAGVAGAAVGLEGILGARRAPAFAQGAKIHLLQWVDFIPEGDVEVRRQVAEYQKQTNVEVTFETINANDLQARITAAVQSGTGP